MGGKIDSVHDLVQQAWDAKHKSDNNPATAVGIHVDADGDVNGATDELVALAGDHKSGKVKDADYEGRIDDIFQKYGLNHADAGHGFGAIEDAMDGVAEHGRF